MKWESSSPALHPQAFVWCADTGSAYRLHRIRTCSRSTRSSRTGTDRAGDSMTFCYNFVNMSCSEADLGSDLASAGLERSYAYRFLYLHRRWRPCGRSLASPGGTVSSSPLSCSWLSASTWTVCWLRHSTLNSGRCLSLGRILAAASSRTTAKTARGSGFMKASHKRGATKNRSV